VRIQTSNCGGPVVVALRSTAALVSHGIEREAMLGAEDGGHLVDRLMLGTVLWCVHADRRGSHHPAALPGSDRDRGEGSTLVVAGGLVANGFVGPAFAREHPCWDLAALSGQDRQAIRRNWPRSCPPNTRW
jgi:hypothetical protein